MHILLKTGLTAAALAALGGAAQAQSTGFCGQPAALTLNTVTIAGEDISPIDGMIQITRGEPAYIDMIVESETGITFETFSNYEDPIAILFNEQGQMVRSDDDGTGTLNSRLGAQLTPGRYCLQVNTLAEIPASSGTLPSGYNTRFPYQISTGIAPGAGGCFDQLGVTVIDQSLTAGADPLILDGALPNGGAVRFSLAEPMPLAIASRSMDFDTILTLEDSFRVELAYDDDSGGGTNSYIGIGDTLPAGEYCAMVGSYDGTNGAYNMTISEWTPQSDEAISSGGYVFDACGDPALTTEIADPLMSGFDALDFAQTLTGGASYFQFTLAESMDLRVTAQSDAMDTVLSLHDADGAEVAYNDDYDGMGTNSRIMTGSALPAGTYCAAVTPYSGDGYGTFDLELIELTEEALLADAFDQGDMLPGDNDVTFTDLGLVERSLRNTLTSGDTEWFLFEVPEESLLLIDAASGGDISRLVLFDYEGSGLEMARAEYDFVAPSVQLAENVGSGIYALAVVRDGSGGNMGPARLSLQRYVRPAR